MQHIHWAYPEISGLKRTPPNKQDQYDYEELRKKIKAEEPIKANIPQPVKIPPLSRIPPLGLPSVHRETTTGLNQLQQLLLLNQSNLLQRYLQVLTLNRLAQQQHSLLNLKRDDSETTCASFTSQSSFSSPMKMPIILTKPLAAEPIRYIIEEDTDYVEKTTQKKNLKVSACKNYIALLCTGFARSILTAEADSELMSFMNGVMQAKKAKYESLQAKSLGELRDFMLEHIHKDICGKRVKKTNKGRDFKVRNTEELEMLLSPKEGDDDMLCFRKETLRAMIDYFFKSKHYAEWLDKGMINKANQNFFLKNKDEIQKKFDNPTLYKPHFDYNSE